MYKLRTKDYAKSDLRKRWALPDRVFFACGACHILTYAFLRRYGTAEMRALWIKPDPGFTGNHIVAATESWEFDYHGYCERERFLSRYFRRARHWLPGWGASLIVLSLDVLVSEAKSRTYDGLWLREPKQFLHDALPRAEAYLDRFAPPVAAPAWSALWHQGLRGYPLSQEPLGELLPEWPRPPRSPG